MLGRLERDDTERPPRAVGHLRGLLRALAVLALLFAVACGESERATPAAPGAAAFDGARAFADLEALVRLGPRPAGSPGAEKARALIRERLRQAGWMVEEHAFEARPPAASPVPMVNVIARREGASPERVLLITHYDTKDIPGIAFVGANDGASGTAVLLELARVLAAAPLPLTTELVFADGEEAFGVSITEQDGLYGSTALAERMQADGSLAQVRSVILVDMVGDRDLNLVVDLGSSPLLRDIFSREARALGRGDIVDESAIMSVIDDHSPFARRGVEHVLALIDFQFGARISPGPLWHTAGDDLDAVSAASLNSVGGVLVEAVRAIEEHWRDVAAPRAQGN
jgi:hypothetical protein